MCKNALYLQNECAKDSHPPTEPAADCKELFMGVEKPPDKGGWISGIDSLISMSVKGRGNASLLCPRRAIAARLLGVEDKGGRILGFDPLIRSVKS